MSDPAPDEFMEIFLQPGECYFGDAETRIRTLLGSCVAITMWHPKKKVGGMCHYLLPTRVTSADAPLEGRFGDEAMFMLLREARRLGCRPKEFDYKIFGGASMNARGKSEVARVNIGARNAEIADLLLDELGVRSKGRDVGGACARSIMLDNWSGDVWVRTTLDSDPALQQELPVSE